LSMSRFEVFVNFNTILTTVATNRLRVGLGSVIPTNTAVSGIDYTSGNIILYQRYIPPYNLSSIHYFGNINNNLLNNNFYYLKFIWDFISGKIEIHKLTNNNNLDAINKIDEFSTNILNKTMNTEGVPLFNFFNSGSLSSVVAIKIS